MRTSKSEDGGRNWKDTGLQVTEEWEREAMRVATRAEKIHVRYKSITLFYSNFMRCKVSSTFLTHSLLFNIMQKQLHLLLQQQGLMQEVLLQ